MCRPQVSSAAPATARVASSSSDPPHWMRVMVHCPPVPAGGVMSVQLATKGQSRRAAAWAITSLPRSLPQASTAPGPSASMT